MRILLIVVSFIYISSPHAFSMVGADFDEFVKSREIVATHYFQSSNEDLNNSVRARLSQTINKLREPQKSSRMIRVEGFSSPEGDQETNLRLSFFRALSVAVLIQSKVLPSEVALTGENDLLASSDDPNKERRVEIVSYLKSVGIKKVKVASKKTTKTQGAELGAPQGAPKDQEIDSYSVKQAIRTKIADKNIGLADKNKRIDSVLFSGLSQIERSLDGTYDLDRGYSQSKQAVDRGLTRFFYSQSKAVADKDLKRGYSQLQKKADPEMSPSLTQVTPAKVPVIDALMIDQAIIEKIGAEPLFLPEQSLRLTLTI